MAGRWRGWKDRLLSVGEHEGETQEQRGRRRIIVAVLWISVPGLAGALVSSPGPWTAALDGLKLAAHAGALLALWLAPRRLALVLHTTFALDLFADVTISIMLGGLLPSGLQILWSLIAVLGTLVGLTVRAATAWFGLFLGGVLVASIVPEWIDPLYRLADPEVDAVVVVIGMTAFAFLELAYFVRQRDHFQRQADDLLHSILPDDIAARLKADRSMIAEDFEEASVLFADVVGFTPLSAEMPPSELVGLLNSVFTRFDGFVEDLGLEKIKTVGDEYMVASGLPTPRSDHAEALAELALRLRDHVAKTDYAGQRLSLRIGINSGPVVAGIIGTHKFSYDMWGDTVNVASRMESEGIPGEIQLSPSTYELLKGRYDCRPRGEVAIKGKGQMRTYLLVGRRTTGP
ncbi:MAG TPA: adenylate/guanylate cyclase domain-containing protein [Acidimicrobiia bacterium]|nr:adenylate/guanylate cyclase domain-containing protein [Acidimicrobiia bacterium]